MISVYAETHYKGVDEDKYLMYTPSMMPHGYVMYSKQLNTEIGKAGTFSFSILQGHPNRDHLHKLSTIITLYDNNKVIWRGRVLDSKKDFYNNQAITCEGCMAFLNDVSIEEFDYSREASAAGNRGRTVSEFITWIIGRYNYFCEQERQIKLGNIYYRDTNKKLYPISDDWKDILSVLDEYVIQEIGGYFYIRYDGDDTYIDYYEQAYIDDVVGMIDAGYKTPSNQIIEFGKNLIDFEEYINATEVFTCLVPLGPKAEHRFPWDTSQKKRYTLAVSGADITVGEGDEAIKAVGNNKYMFSELGVKVFGKIFSVSVYDDVEYDDQHDATYYKGKLFDAGLNDLRNSIKAAVELNLTAVDLTKAGVNVDALRLGDYVKVRSIPHGIDTYYMLTSITEDFDKPEQTKYVLGWMSSTFTEKQVADKKKQSAAIQANVAALSDIASNS